MTVPPLQQLIRRAQKERPELGELNELIGEIVWTAWEEWEDGNLPHITGIELENLPMIDISIIYLQAKR